MCGHKNFFRVQSFPNFFAYLTYQILESNFWMNEITLKYLAEKLNIATSTVSRALNDSHEISESTKRKVIALAESLNFQPNAYAKGLRQQKTKTIAVIVPDRSNHFFNLVIEGVENVCRTNGYSLIVYNSHEDVEQEKKIVFSLLGGKVDAVVMSLTDEKKEVQHLDLLKKKNIPVVFFDRVSNNISGIKFITNDQESAFQGTKFLLEKGCRKIAFLGLNNTGSVGNARREGFIQAHKEFGVPIDTELIKAYNHNEQQIQTELEQLFYKISRPDGVLAAAEKLGIATYRAISKVKIHIPNQVRVVSFSNMKIPDLLNPPLSTIAQPAFEMGRACASVLLEGLKKSNTNFYQEKITIIPSVFTPRESSQ